MSSKTSSSITILARESIVRNLDERNIVIDPLLEENQIGSVSVDLRLDNALGEFLSTQKALIDPSKDRLDYIKLSEIEFYREPYSLQAGHFVLGKTFEYVALPNNMVGLLEGRSSVGRQGLMVHVTAGAVDPGFAGHLVFELANVGRMPILLYPLMRIARITFVETESTEGYAGKFAIQLRIRMPTVDEDLKKIREITDHKRDRTVCALCGQTRKSDRGSDSKWDHLSLASVPSFHCYYCTRHTNLEKVEHFAQAVRQKEDEIVKGQQAKPL